MKSRIVRGALTALCICSLAAGLSGCSNPPEKEEVEKQDEPKEVVDYNEDENSNLGPWANTSSSSSGGVLARISRISSRDSSRARITRPAPRSCQARADW